MDDKVELGQVFQPLHLVAVQEFGHGEIFKVFVIGEDINGCCGTFEIVISVSRSSEVWLWGI